MFVSYFEAGGPVMYAVFAAWVVVFAAVLDRGCYAIGRVFRRPARRIRALYEAARPDEAARLAEREREVAERGLTRIESVSQLATSIGLFGTVLGIARSFFARGGEGSQLAAPEALAAGLSTALYTTIAGLVVFLFGQSASILFREWIELCERGQRVVEPALSKVEPD